MVLAGGGDAVRTRSVADFEVPNTGTI
jgi:hypothetical protein